MRKSSYSEDDLRAAVKSSTSIAQVLRVLNIKTAGGSHYHISRRIKKLEIDTSHFLGQGCNKGKSPAIRQTPEEILVVITGATRYREKASKLRRALTEIGRLVECVACGISDAYNGKPIRLHIDHINGNPLDCRANNLRYLCPNCHSQTSTFGRIKKRS